MSDRQSDPPRRAIQLLERLGPASYNEALTGDLIENFMQDDPAAGSGGRLSSQSQEVL
jgi:hypothetical protein